MVWLGRCHHAFAVANCVFNLRFAAALLDHVRKKYMRRRLEAATDCWQGPQYDRKCSFYFNCYFFRTTPTNRDLIEKAVYFPPRRGAIKGDAQEFVQTNLFQLGSGLEKVLIYP